VLVRQDPPGHEPRPGAFLSGKTLTIKVTGTNPLIPRVCKALKNAPFKASQIGS